MKVSQFNKLIKGVRIFCSMIDKIEVLHSVVMKSDPNEYAMALRAAAGAANCPANQLALVIFGRTLKGQEFIRNLRVGYVDSADSTYRLDTLFSSPADLVRLTFGEPDHTIGKVWHDQTAFLFS